MNARIRIGFAGVGTMGQCAHLRNYAALDGCVVVAISDPRRKTAAQVAARYGVANVYDDAAAMLAHETLDAIVASQPFTRHGIIIPQLLEAGVPIFTEKPLSSTVESGERIVDAVDASNTWIMVGYHKRSDPAVAMAIEEARRLQDTGELGRLTYIRSLMPAGDWTANGFTGCIDAGDARPTLATDPPANDMDAETFEEYVEFVNYYIHQVNLIRHFLGEPYRVTYADPAGVVLHGVSDSGVPVTLEMSPFRTSRDWQEHLLVCFEKGWLRVDLPAPLARNRPGNLTIMRDPGDGATPITEQPLLPWVHAMRQQAINFIDAVRGERPPLCTAAEALEDLRLAKQYITLRKGL